MPDVGATTDLLNGNLGNILHITARSSPRVTELTRRDLDDWQIALEHWRMVQRRKPTKLQG